MIFLIVAVIFASFYVGISVLYPLGYKGIVLENAERNNLDAELIFAVIKTESNFTVDAISNKGAKGLMQISDSTGKWGSEVLNISNYNAEMLYDPEINISIGSWYLKLLIDQYKDVDTALAAYNAGSGNVSRWLSDSSYSIDGVSLNDIPFPETHSYVKKVNNNLNVYSRFYGDRIHSDEDLIFERPIFLIRTWLMNIRNNR